MREIYSTTGCKQCPANKLTYLKEVCECSINSEFEV